VDTIQQILARTPLFGGLAKDQLDKVRDISQERTVRKGETVFWEGDAGIGFYIVADGLVKIFKVSAEGKEQILHIYGPGHPFGEVAVFAGHNYPASAQAVENSRVVFLPRQAFIDLIAAHPSLTMNMLAILSMRLRHFTVQVENLSLKEVPGRLASYLLYLAKEQNTDDTVNLPISKGQLASLLGTIPETLSRIFNKMTAQKMIAVQGSEIRLLDREVLEELAVSGRLIG
jgi:CRP/FNR family transcriptional regulator